jgi:hypothetical protein
MPGFITKLRTRTAHRFIPAHLTRSLNPSDDRLAADEEALRSSFCSGWIMTPGCAVSLRLARRREVIPSWPPS